MGRRAVAAVIVTIGGLAVLLALTRKSAPPVPESPARRSSTPAGLAALPDEWDRADLETVRLSPEKFPALPPPIAARLRTLGCSVPQARGEPGPHNVITGRFTASQNADWAVLCSRQRVSSILVFPQGLVDSMIELEANPDRGWLQGVGGGQIGFSRVIEVATPEDIMAYFKAYGGPEPPPLDHDGINNIFVGKASAIRYWYGERWLELQGAD